MIPPHHWITLYGSSVRLGDWILYVIWIVYSNVVHPDLDDSIQYKYYQQSRDTEVSSCSFNISEPYLFMKEKLPLYPVVSIHQVCRHCWQISFLNPLSCILWNKSEMCRRTRETPYVHTVEICRFFAGSFSCKYIHRLREKQNVASRDWQHICGTVCWQGIN